MVMGSGGETGVEKKKKEVLGLARKPQKSIDLCVAQEPEETSEAGGTTTRFIGPPQRRPSLPIFLPWAQGP